MKEERQRKFWGVKIKDLSNLLNQPVEIFYEVLSPMLILFCFADAPLSKVLGHLHPLDFYHLARTTKQFRALVISRKFAWLWNLVFERNPSIPPCPPDLSAPKWVDLMFSPLICDVGEFYPLSKMFSNTPVGMRRQQNGSEAFLKATVVFRL